MGKLYSFDFNDAKPQHGEPENRLPPEVAFVDFIKEKGFNPPEFVIQDGTIHRYGKNKVDWYVYFPDGNNAGGAFGCWNKDEDNLNWCYLGANMSDDQRSQHNERMRQIHKQINEERQRVHAQAREEVAKVWAEAKEATDHPYLRKKNVKAHGVKIHKGDLIIPMMDKDGLLHSLQRITPGCVKLNWAGGAVAGYYHTIPGSGKFAYLCEGYATGATIHEATGATVYIAFSAGNLKTVSPLLPDNVIVAADDDRETKGNPGLSAALATKRQVISPKGLKGTDFNDLASEKGLDEVRRQLNQSTNKYTKRVLVGPALHAGFLQTLKMGWTIDKVLPESSMLTVIFGPPSGGKSFTALDMCCSIDSGKDWHGRKVKQKPVLYLAAEGQAGMLKRIEAWKQRRKVDLPTFALLPMPCLIDEDSQRRELINMITELPQKPGIIVLDTLARSMTGDENSTSDMGKVVIAAGILIEETGAQVIIIHHTGKDESRGPRGAIALTGATDAMFKVVRLKEDKKFALLCERQKDDEPFAPMIFDFHVVDTGFKNVDGDNVCSLVPEFNQEATQEFGEENNEKDKKVRLTKIQEKALLALDVALREKGIPPPDDILPVMTGLITPITKVLAFDDWKAEAKRIGISVGEDRAKNQALKRAAEHLESKKIVTMYGGYAWKNK